MEAIFKKIEGYPVSQIFEFLGVIFKCILAEGSQTSSHKLWGKSEDPFGGPRISW